MNGRMRTLLIFGGLLLFVVASMSLQGAVSKWSCKDCTPGAGTLCMGLDSCNGDVQDCTDCVFRCGTIVNGEIVYGGFHLDCVLV